MSSSIPSPSSPTPSHASASSSSQLVISGNTSSTGSSSHAPGCVRVNATPSTAMAVLVTRLSRKRKVLSATTTAAAGTMDEKELQTESKNKTVPLTTMRWVDQCMEQIDPKRLNEEMNVFIEQEKIDSIDLQQWALQSNIHLPHRSELFDWLLEVSVAERLTKATAWRAIHLVDRYVVARARKSRLLNGPPPVGLNEYQWIGAVCLWISSKFESNPRHNNDAVTMDRLLEWTDAIPTDFPVHQDGDIKCTPTVDSTKGTPSTATSECRISRRQQIIALEKDILALCEYKINPIIVDRWLEVYV
jgi:hypothetical protein